MLCSTQYHTLQFNAINTVKISACTRQESGQLLLHKVNLTGTLGIQSATLNVQIGEQDRGSLQMPRSNPPWPGWLGVCTDKTHSILSFLARSTSESVKSEAYCKLLFYFILFSFLPNYGPDVQKQNKNNIPWLKPCGHSASFHEVDTSILGDTVFNDGQQLPAECGWSVTHHMVVPKSHWFSNTGHKIANCLHIWPFALRYTCVRRRVRARVCLGWWADCSHNYRKYFVLFAELRCLRWKRLTQIISLYI